jgi:hypothetical protein
MMWVCFTLDSVSRMFCLHEEAIILDVFILSLL